MLEIRVSKTEATLVWQYQIRESVTGKFDTIESRVSKQLRPPSCDGINGAKV